MVLRLKLRAFFHKTCFFDLLTVIPAEHRRRTLTDKTLEGLLALDSYKE